MDLDLDLPDLGPVGGSSGVKAPLELELAEIAKLLRDPNQDGTLDLSVLSISALVAPPALELLLLYVARCAFDGMDLSSKCCTKSFSTDPVPFPDNAVAGAVE